MYTVTAKIYQESARGMISSVVPTLNTPPCMCPHLPSKSIKTRSPGADSVLSWRYKNIINFEKKIMKKILYIFVFLLVSITASAYDAKIDGIYYDLVPKAKVAIVTEGDTKYEGDISIPSTFEYEGVEYTVTEITGKAFYYSTNLRSLTIPNSVKTIGRQAFFCCENLRKLVLPDELEELPSSICSMCHQLTEIHMPNRLRTISADAFYECVSLTSISLPEDLVEIGGDAFRDCISLTSMVIPDHVSILFPSRKHCSGHLLVLNK